MTEHTFRVSGFERNENERYFTHPTYTVPLLPFIPEYVREGQIWEPAAGRGDITRVLVEDGYDVVSSDVDLSEFDFDLGSAQPLDFLATSFDFEMAGQYRAIITNPPYGRNPRTGKFMAEEFVRKALEHEVDFIAMFLRAEFNHASSRTDLWAPPFAFELVCTSRPRWDWWLPDPDPDDTKEIEKRKNSPMHVYSWYVWDRQREGPSTQHWIRAEKT